MRVENWRPITLLNIEWKMFTSVVKTKMEERWTDEMGVMQIGFRKGRWIQENHLLLQSLIQKRRKFIDALLFVDFQRAYDSISHKFAAKKMETLGGMPWRELTRKILGGTSLIWVGGQCAGEVQI